MSVRCTVCCATSLLVMACVLIDSTLAQVAKIAEKPSPEGVGRSREIRTTGWYSSTTMLSPDGKIIAVAGDEITLIELASGKRLANLRKKILSYCRFSTRAKRSCQ